VPPDAALQIVEHNATRFGLITLTPEEHLAALRTFVGLGLTGAMIYDALILACARKVDAEHIYTLDQRDFRRIAPDLASRILEP
jgi:predicted nucleic acid-binding protein